jgi:mRNA-degrading endonuclease RelE of RelBE toxin-antitoxin system
MFTIVSNCRRSFKMVGQIKGVRFSKKFKKQYKTLPNEIRQAFKEKLKLLITDMLHSSLRIKKIQGVQNRWEGSITMKYRFTFHFEDDTVVFRTIGTHDILLRDCS